MGQSFNLSHNHVLLPNMWAESMGRRFMAPSAPCFGPEGGANLENRLVVLLPAYDCIQSMGGCLRII